jgi:DNA-directed RNA polymerase specialized sigma24 family protein
VIRCRDLSASSWQDARKPLIFYFGQRTGYQNAEDLTQQTFTAIWSRNPEIQNAEDFLKLCYGFARNIVLAGLRDQRKHRAELVDPATPGPRRRVAGLLEAELDVFMHELETNALVSLKPDERAMIEAIMKDEMPDLSLSGRLRVKLLRLRRKFAKKTGWTRDV